MVNKIIDLRSDTVTLPTEEMLEAIKNAKLGDDVFGEDPTVNALENVAAKKMGKEAALLVTSGTQGNLVSILSHTKRGDEVILEADAHIYHYELGGLSAIAGVLPRPIKGKMGILAPEAVEEAIRPPNPHFPRTTLLCLENTHNLAGGICMTPLQTRKVSEVAAKHGLAVHIDGARIFNAAVALDVDVKHLVSPADSVMFCLSKGLSAPIGSVVVGSSSFIERARRMRKMLGGGMRQAGIIAAAGLVALEKMVDRLKEDHINARLLAEGLAKIDGIKIDVRRVQTNIVMFDVSNLGVSGSAFISALSKYGIKALTVKGNLIRMVTHRGIDKEDIIQTLEVIKDIATKKLI
ncbi:MAG: low-specificity L-threonine aldolase [Nitrososphaerales archaeon]